MSRLDAVASESYHLEPTVTQETTEPIEEPTVVHQIESEEASKRTPTPPITLLEKEPIPTLPPSDIPQTTTEPLTEAQDEEEDKFSDFDPTTLPEEDPETSTKSNEILSAVNVSENKAESRIKSDTNPSPTHDYMSDVSSGEDFLSATHDHSGPEDGEVSEGEEALTLNQCENDISGATIDTPIDPNSTQAEKEGFINDCTLTKGEAQVEDKEEESYEKSNPPVEEHKNLPELQASNSNILVDNASPFNDEDLDSLEDYEHDNDSQTKHCANDKEQENKQASEENKSNYEGGNSKESLNKCETSNSLESNLNPEPIDSSPELLTNCGDGNDEDLPNYSEKTVISASCQNNSNVEGEF